MRHDRLALEAELRHRQRAGEIPQFVIDKEAADVILFKQRLDGAVGQLAFLSRNIDQIGSPIGGDDDVGLCRILSEQAIAEPGMSVVGNAGVLVVWVVQRQVQRLRQIDSHEAERQEILRRILVRYLCRRAGLALLRDRREAVIGGDDDVGRRGEAEFVQRFAQLRQVIVGVPDAGHRGRSVDARRDGVEAVAGIVLAAVGIARPEHQHERLVARLEHRQYDLGRDVGHVGLLRDIRRRGARCFGVAGLAVFPARGRHQGEAGLGQRVLHFIGQRHAILATSGVVDHDGILATVGMVEKIGRTKLADRGGAVALLARHLQKRLFVQIVAAEMLVDLEQDGIDLEERRHRVVGVGDGAAGVDRVAEGAGIAEVMAAGHRRAVRHGEGREQRMRVLEIDALVAHLGHRRRGLRRHDAPAQTIRHEQDQVTRGGVLRGCRACDECDQTG